ncbi:MAG TPA: hypothetical protein VN238_11790 [Solirubrobacteraceae bacterium]|nr:hypothetical protein [Solirubrobacteraceae bacterium]
MRKIHRSLLAAGALLLIAGCGSEDTDYGNEPRPPARITVTARIGDEGVSVSPRSFGAGPVQLVVSNQTDEAQELTLETDEIGGDDPGIKQNSGPINPGDTASLQANLGRGTYRVGVDARGIDATRLKVGRERPSAQNQLLQP